MSPDVKVPVEVDGRTLTLTNLGKVLYPDSGFTKAEVLDYYQRVAPALPQCSRGMDRDSRELSLDTVPQVPIGDTGESGRAPR